ncbi:MAG TPA: hypothetical protein VGL10_00690 [Gammaproteobacteria bacterium]
MRKLIIGVCLFAATLGVSAQPAKQAQNPFAPPNVNIANVPLTADSIQKVLASYSRLREEFKDYKPSPNAQDMQAYIQTNNALKKSEEIVRGAGFRDWPDWHANFAKVMQTYMAYKMQESGKVNQAQIQQQMQAIQSNSSLTPEQKQMALSMMGMANMYTQMTANVSQAELQIFAPFANQFEQVMRAGN